MGAICSCGNKIIKNKIDIDLQENKLPTEIKKSKQKLFTSTIDKAIQPHQNFKATNQKIKFKNR